MEFNLVELLKYFEIDGKWGLILVLFCFVFWVLFSNDKLSSKIRIKIIESFSSASSSIHIEQERLSEKINTDIDTVLDNLQKESNANNVLVVRFRNGTYDSMGSSILKFFASNEKAKAGYLQIGDKIQNISRTLYGNFCDTLIKEHKVYIKDKKLISENQAELLGLMNLFGDAEKFYARSLITTESGQIIGFICLVYNENVRMAESKIDELLVDACSRVVAKIEMGKININKKKKK